MTVKQGETTGSPLEARVDHQARIGWLQTVILALSALIAVLAALYTGHIAQKQQEFESEIFANQTWESYRRLEMEYVEKFGEEFGSPNAPEQQNILYWLWVERLLMAADGITISLEKDPQWRDSFVYEFLRHRDYLLGEEFLKSDGDVMSSYCTYRTGVRAWLRKAFERDERAKALLSAAERECLATLDREGFEE